eukprot:TRINITY_DN30870_c0_g1_i1.p1 TRINITY_DN30870_c0_g1~~TRINITY_DN30870_c0_g1_i1.p1  ORF type:complete len:927 (+),score=155.37 TRINITY_DN30870_c0_g1_i1:35-2782(+)
MESTNESEAAQPTENENQPKQQHGVASTAGGRDDAKFARRTSEGKRRKRPVKTEEELCRELFDLIDVDLGGEIDPNEMERFMRIVDPTAPPAVVQEVLNIADEDKNGVVDFSEFVDLALGGYFGEPPSILLEKYKGGLVRVERRGGWERYLKALPKPEDIPHIEARHVINKRTVDYLRRTANPVTLFKQMFDTMDTDADGCLSHEEMARMVKIVLPDAKPSLVQAVIRSADKDGNGDIDFEEFQIAVEEGSFGIPAEELLPKIQRGLKRLKDGRQEIDTKAALQEPPADEVLLAMDQVRQMQYEAAEKRKTTKLNDEEQTRIRLRSRLVNFYARHNPEKVREADISKVVNTTIERNIHEDDLFRSLYRKYNLDEAGEPIEEESDWDASSSEEIDEEALTEEERHQLEIKRKQKEEYRRIKKEEILHKAVQQQIQKEAREERQRSKAAREKFLNDWKTEEERKADDIHQKAMAEKAEADLKIKLAEDAIHRGLNRRAWLDALGEAKQQRFEERCIKLEKKKLFKRTREAVYAERKNLERSLLMLERERNLQVKYSQRLRMIEVLIDSQNEKSEKNKPPIEATQLEFSTIQAEVDKLKSNLKETQIKRDQFSRMYTSNRQYSITLQEITDSMLEELQERKESIKTLRQDTLDHLRKTKEGTLRDVTELEDALDSSLETLQASLKHCEEKRLQDMYTRKVKESDITLQLLSHKEHCDKEIGILKERLLELYPSLIRDAASLIGKRGAPQAKYKSVKSTRDSSKDRDSETVASLELWKPKDIVTDRSGGTVDEFSGILSIKHGSVFDMAGHVFLGDGGPPATPCEALPSSIFDAARSGSVGSLWDLETPLDFSSSDDLLFPFTVGTLRRWIVRTERGATLEVTIHSRPAKAHRATPTPTPDRKTARRIDVTPNPPPSIA